MSRRWIVLLAVAISLGMGSPFVWAATLKVNCDRHQTISSALQVITASNPQGPNTIQVSGSCKENVLVQSLDRVTLITNNGASISDGSGGTMSVVLVRDSRSITVQGLRIEGGAGGLICSLGSVCYVNNNTIQSSSGNGITVNYGSTAVLSGNLIQNNAAVGLQINFDSRAISVGDSFQGNPGAAVRVLASYFFCNGSMIQNNGSNDNPAGIVGLEGARLRFGGCTISNNLGDGVLLVNAAEGRFTPGNVITGNAGSGVSLRDLAFADFNTNNITGNLSDTDVLCAPQYSATRGATTDIGGGTTNCVEP
jgi:nitrous oxidase accessory protein NosD